MGLPKTYASAPGGAVQVPQIYSGTLAARPAPGTYPQIAGEPVYYWATDIVTMFQDTGAAWVVVGAQWYMREIPTYGAWGIKDDYEYPSTNWVMYSPLQIPRPCTLEGVILWHGGVSTNNLYVALYDHSGYLPNNRLAVSLSTAAAAAGTGQFVAFTAPVRVTPNLYFAALISQGSQNYPYVTLYPIAPANVTNGLRFFSQNMGAFLPPPAVATPVYSTDNHRYQMAVQVSAIP